MPPPRRHGDYSILARLGENIRAARNRAGITQEKLAEAIDIHPRVLQKIEAGDSNAKSTTLIRIQAVLGASWESIIPKIRR